MLFRIIKLRNGHLASPQRPLTGRRSPCCWLQGHISFRSLNPVDFALILNKLSSSTVGVLPIMYSRSKAESLLQILPYRLQLADDAPPLVWNCLCTHAIDKYFCTPSAAEKKTQEGVICITGNESFQTPPACIKSE